LPRKVINLTNQQISALIALTAANFPNMQEREMRPTANLWKELLGDMPFEVAKAAIIKVLATTKFWPTVAEIREAAAQLTGPQIISPAEAWALVERANDNYGYYRPIEGMKTLPPLVQTTIRALGGFRDVCASENVGVTRGQFMKMYEQYAVREKEMSVLPESVKQFIGGVTKLLPESEG
jgi:hypothetical protein